MSLQTAHEYNCDRQYHAMVSRDEAIAEMIDELLDGEYKPTAVDNIVDALNRASRSNDIQCMAIEQAFKDGDILLAGEIIKAISEHYWTVKAEADATAKLAERDAEMREFHNDF